jgi:hypothetical protein
MALSKNPFSRIQTTKSRYLEAENALAPLTMITGPEALALAKAGQELIGTNEELIYKYRDEFLHIQRAAENGLTTLNMLVEDAEEFGILARAWGFVATVRSRFDTKILYTKNLAETETTTELSNIMIDWTKPTKPTIDVDYYRASGNAVLIEDSTLAVPVFARLNLVKRILGIEKAQERAAITVGYTQAGTGNNVGGSGAVIPLSVNRVGSYVVSYFPTQGGRGYRVGDEIVVYGNDLFGTVTSNAVFTVLEVDAFGAMANVRVTGTASGLSINQFLDGQVLIQLLSNNFAKVIQLAPGAS